ncbi:MAG: DUF1461 domain-containing protein, partial [Eggerthellaceae bacterium]|nr:DUF1461 domain-containing protein [Eggerthellaceae bacterium]
SVLSSLFSNFDNSAYTHEDLISLAVATRDYTVDAYGEVGVDEATLILTQKELDAANEATSDGSSATGEWSEVALNALKKANSLDDPYEGTLLLASISDRYALDDNALTHLQDCNKLINAVVPWLWLAFAVAVISILCLGIFAGKRWLGLSLLLGPIVLIAVVVVLGIWGAIDFQGLFRIFHQVFFPQGNWAFSSESLLITMYPTNFWIGMGATWIGTTAILSILSIVFGIILRRKKRIPRGKHG